MLRRVPAWSFHVRRQQSPSAKQESFIVLQASTRADVTHVRPKSRILWRVTPGRIRPFKGGVTSSVPNTSSRAHLDREQGSIPTSVLVLQTNEHIHRADFGDVLLIAVKPENLLATLCLSHFIYIDGRAIVSREVTRLAYGYRASFYSRARLVGAHPTGKCSTVKGVCQQGDRFEACWKVRADGTGDNEQQRFVWRSNTQCRLNSDAKRSSCAPVNSPQYRSVSVECRACSISMWVPTRRRLALTS